MSDLQRQLMESIAEVLAIHPDWRLGQLIANLTDRVKQPDSQARAAEAIWDIEDEELLASARGFLNQRRRQLGLESSSDAVPASADIASQEHTF